MAGTQGAAEAVLRSKVWSQAQGGHGDTWLAPIPCDPIVSPSSSDQPVLGHKQQQTVGEAEGSRQQDIMDRSQVGQERAADNATLAAVSGRRRGTV